MKIRQGFAALAACAAGLCLAIPAWGGLSLAPSTGTSASTSAAGTAASTAASTNPDNEELVYSLIVKPHQRRGRQQETQLEHAKPSALERATKLDLRVTRRMSGGEHVIRLPHAMPLSEARALAARLMQERSVELAEPDRIVKPLMMPNDPSFAPMQWNLAAPSSSSRGGINMPAAWDMTTGSAQVTVAVLDGGYVPHNDLAPVLPGYDFLAASSLINGVWVGNGDGDGRDADPRDPGTYTAANECNDGGAAQRSPWHGTHVAGIIAAAVNNGLGGAGIAPNVRILPVRVLGHCGGPISDIVDGMRWAAGLYALPGAGVNPNPARVLNMSLGSSGACSAVFQSAVSDVTNAGKMVVVAAGNDGAGLNQPANCSGAIAVTAHSVEGDLATYANTGSAVTISAPGGGCGRNSVSCLSTWSANGMGVYSLSNSGSTTPVASPGGDSYAVMTGTSMAAPHVSGVIALMLSLEPTLSRAQVISYLRASARPFPAGTSCAAGGAYAGKCGAGLLDAAAALSIIAPVIDLASNSMVVPPLTYVNLNANVSAPQGRSITSVTWAPLPGNPDAVTLYNAATPNAGFNAPQSGTFGFVVTAMDSSGKSASQTVTVRVNSPPVIEAPANQSVNAGANIRFQLNALDQDGDAVVFYSPNLPPGATLSASGDFDWPDSQSGTYAVTLYATDNTSTSAPATVTLAVAGGSGGGGAMDLASLLVLFMLVAALRVRGWWQARRAACSR